MRFFDLLNLQDVVLYLFPALVFVILFGLALAYSHFRTPRSEDRTNKIVYVFPDGIEDRRAPFPLALTLIIIGTVIWGFLYILVSGLLRRTI
jgi:hypothetical protein